MSHRLLMKIGPVIIHDHGHIHVDRDPDFSFLNIFVCCKNKFGKSYSFGRDMCSLSASGFEIATTQFVSVMLPGT